MKRTLYTVPFAFDLGALKELAKSKTFQGVEPKVWGIEKSA
jgi:hypothetical protein